MKSPLHSHALGSGLSSLVAPCNDTLRPAHPTSPAEGPTIGIALSGGGFRATFAALGVFRFLADAGLLGNVRYVSSVSGGSVANGVVASNWPAVRATGFDAQAVDRLIIDPISDLVASQSLRTKVVRNMWRAVGRSNRTDVLAWAFDQWLFDGAELARLDSQVRWIFNAANLTTGSRFAFERDVVGDYVVGLAPTNSTDLRLAQAVAASAAVPGVLAPMKIRGIEFPCAQRGEPELLDGGTYDNTGLEALNGERYRDVFLISINAGGVFVTKTIHGLPIVRDLARSNSLLYRQSTSLRTRWMVERFKAWDDSVPVRDQDEHARRGVLFGLATTVTASGSGGTLSEGFHEFANTHPELRTFGGKDLAFVPTVFNRLDRNLLDALVYRGWWLTGATLAQHHHQLAPIAGDLEPPPVSARAA